MHTGDGPRHIPVLQTDGGTPVERTVLGILKPMPGETVLDCTLGLGGHAAAFLAAVGGKGRVIGLDADAENLAVATERLGAPATFQPMHRNFRDAGNLGITPDVVFADLGVSSPHFDDPARGFTFRASGPLDLRYDRSSGKPASALIARWDEDDITSVFREYGELREAKRLARAIVAAGKEKPIATTDDLRAIVEATTGYRAASLLPQVFQALRIAVNDELGALRSLLDAIPAILAPGGRAGIISYHSLEDRLVKHAFRAWATPEKDVTTGTVSRPADYEVLTAKAVTPSDDEQSRNPRSRSAKFRAIRRLR